MWPSPTLSVFVDVACAAGSSSVSPDHKDLLGTVKALLCQDAGWQAVPSGLHWNTLPFSLPLSFPHSLSLPLSLSLSLCISLVFIQPWVHATHINSHTCMLEHWQQLLWNCLVLWCFCVFSWQLKHLACIKLPRRHGQINFVCCIGHRHYHYQQYSLCLTNLLSQPASFIFIRWNESILRENWVLSSRYWFECSINFEALL